MVNIIGIDMMDLLTPKFELFTDHDSIIDDKRYVSDNNQQETTASNNTNYSNAIDNGHSIANAKMPIKKYKKKRQQCTKCSKSYSKREYLSKHMKTEHDIVLEKKRPGRQSAYCVNSNDPRPYKCDQCVKEYTKSKHLTRHRRTHLEQKGCNICREVCHNYAEHMLKRHGIDLPRPFECDICKKTYRTKTNIQSHMRIHRAASRVFACTVCSKSFCFGTDLRKHMKSHSQNRSIICDVCGDAFKSADTLKCHLRRHTGERPYKCSQCPRAFGTSNSLDIHFRTHTGERPFQCEYCEKSFADSSTLNVHKRLHTNENPYVCHLCGRRTKQASNLRSHYKHFHKNNDITGRQIRSNSRIFNRFTQSEIDAQLLESGGLIALLEKGLQAFHQEEQEKNNQIEKALKESITVSSTTRPNNAITKAATELDLKIKSVPLRSTQDEVKVKLENGDDNDNTDYFDDDNDVYDDDDDITSKVATIPKQIENTTINQKKTPATGEYLIDIKDVDLKIESVFLEDDEYQAAEMVDSMLDDVKIKHESDSDGDDVWQNTVSDGNEPYDDVKLETTLTDAINNPSETIIKKSPKHSQSDDDAANFPIKCDDNSNEDDGDSNDEMDSKDLTPSKSKQHNQKTKPPAERVEMERCKPCGRKFHDMSRHWIQFHSGIERPYECFICHKMYKRFEHIKYHMKTHGEERNYICHVCGDAFFLSNELRKHIMNRHQVERPFKCTFQQCKGCFKNQHALNVHSRTHSGVKPYVCAVCSDSFSALSSLKIHERKHTGEKPYKCKFCGKSFSDSSTHKQHVRIHTGDKPYKCHLCDRRTAQAGNLKSHYRHYHKVIVKSVSMFVDHNGPYPDETPRSLLNRNNGITAYPLLDSSTRRIEE